jgi:hypothetical protein
MNNEALKVIIELVQNQHGWFMPVVVDAVNNHIKNSRMRFVVSVLLSVVVAGLLNYDQVFSIDSFSDAGVFMATVSLLFAQAQISYNLYWKKSEARKALYGDTTNKSKLP